MGASDDQGNLYGTTSLGQVNYLVRNAKKGPMHIVWAGTASTRPIYGAHACRHVGSNGYRRSSVLDLHE